MEQFLGKNVLRYSLTVVIVLIMLYFPESGETTDGKDKEDDSDNKTDVGLTQGGTTIPSRAESVADASGSLDDGQSRHESEDGEWKVFVYRALENIVVTSIFSLLYNAFYFIKENLHPLSRVEIVVCDS